MFAPHDSRIELAAAEPSERRPPLPPPRDGLAGVGAQHSALAVQSAQRLADSSQRDDKDMCRAPPESFLTALLRALAPWTS